jgi:Family of unknown function (DUF5995)
LHDPVDPIEAVATRMDAIAAPLKKSDGVACLNELYRAVTRAVAVETGADTFKNPAFISRLDVVFAGLYFTAVDDSLARRSIPKAWAPLFEKRHTAGIAPLQFAIAGMNAHINHDLALALVATSKERRVELDRGTPQHHDYGVVDGILERVQDDIKDRFRTGIVKAADKALGRHDDVLASWSVSRARDNAWTQAQTLAVLDGSPFLRKQFLLALARNVGFASRALLTLR